MQIICRLFWFYAVSAAILPNVLCSKEFAILYMGNISHMQTVQLQISLHILSERYTAWLCANSKKPKQPANYSQAV